MEDSLFSKIIKGEIPCHKIYEDNNTFAFLDINPIATGHTLVVPKRQVEFVWDLRNDEYLSLMVTTKNVALRLRATLGSQYIGQKIVGTDVPHAHVHLIPFSSVAEYNNKPDISQTPDHNALAALAQKLAFLTP